MKAVLIFLGAILNLFASDFITLKEYSKMLYENPRGISCKKCHGNDGSEQNLSFEEFQNSLNQDKDAKSIMPNYSLTNDEIITLYNYIKQSKKEQK